MSRKMRKSLKEQGWAVLIISVMLLILLQVSTFDIILTNVAQLKTADTYVAIGNGERVSVATISPIRVAITKYVQNQLPALLQKRMNDYTANKLSSCIQSIAANEGIDKQYAICQPVNLLDNLQGATKQTIDFYSAMKPKATKAQANNPDYDYELGELEREAFNEFDYELQPTFVSVKVLQPTGANSARVELYRYIVQADVNTHTYADIRSHLRIDFDVLIYVGSKSGEDISECDPNAVGDGGIGFLVGYEKDCGIGKCKLFAKGSDGFKRECTGPCLSGLNILVNGGNPNKLSPAQKAAVAGKEPIGAPREPFGNGGCVTGEPSSEPGYYRNLLSWEVVVRPVALGQTYN